MSFFKALFIAFAIYSKIPVPHFDWKEKEMKYQVIFFPWVGAVIGALMVLWNFICIEFNIGTIAYVLIMTAIPLLITGGFHVDGYMDTMDALKSYKSKKEKLEILKDPHVGAFAVIMLAVIGLVYMAGLSEVVSGVIVSLAGGFVLSRALSGIAIYLFKNAKKEGMLNTFNRSADNAKNTVVGVLIVEAVIAAAFMIITNPAAGTAMCIVCFVTFLYYYKMSMKNFGGITGDTAGFFVVLSETAMVVTAAVVSVVCGRL